MVSFHKDVQDVARVLSDAPTDALSEIAAKLTVDSPEVKKMWKTLEKRKAGSDELWVWGFLGAAADAAHIPAFHNLTVRERKDIAKEVTKLSSSLAGALEKHELDGHLVYCQGSTFNGFYLYEALSQENRAQIDKARLKKVALSHLLRSMADHCVERISDEPERGKQGQNAKAIRFIRVLGKRNALSYGSPLNSVLMAAANAIFDTQYSESDVAHLLNR